VSNSIKKKKKVDHKLIIGYSTDFLIFIVINLFFYKHKKLMSILFALSLKSSHTKKKKKSQWYIRYLHTCFIKV
jgi:hypothetical protein